MVAAATAAMATVAATLMRPYLRHTFRLLAFGDGGGGCVGGLDPTACPAVVSYHLSCRLYRWCCRRSLSHHCPAACRAVVAVVALDFWWSPQLWRCSQSRSHRLSVAVPLPRPPNGGCGAGSGVGRDDPTTSLAVAVVVASCLWWPWLSPHRARTAVVGAAMTVTTGSRRVAYILWQNVLAVNERMQTVETCCRFYPVSDYTRCSGPRPLRRRHPPLSIQHHALR